MSEFDPLRLENQLCFPLYVCSKEIVRRYRPLLEPLGLTYTQYIVMMMLWEHHALSVSHLGKSLYLDSGTLTPILKKMEKSGWVRRERNHNDERQVIVTITAKGQELKELCADIPERMASCLITEQNETVELYRLLRNFMNNFNQ